MQIITGIEQGSLEWHELRRGKVTGTCLADIMGSEQDRLKLIAELIAEEGTEQSKILKPTVEMERGIAEEIFTIKRYEDKFKVKVDRVTFCISDDFNWLAYSPDGLVKIVKGIEIKNPDSKTMILYKMNNLVDGIKIPPAKRPFCGIPQEYKWQVVCSFIVNKEQEDMDFIISDARFIEDEHKMYIINIKRDNPELQEAINQALEELPKFRQQWLRIKEIVLPIKF